MPALPRITLLLTTYNGAAFLRAQLDSYLAQTHEDWDLWVSDDGSGDDTLAILDAFARTHRASHDIRILQGPGRGSAANFMFLLTHPDLPAGPVALSDQDDVWLPHKLATALTALATAPPVTLYGAQSVHTDAALTPTGRSLHPRHPPCFGNALVQNIVSGHSAVLSPGALELVRRAGLPVAPVPYHDWWLYQLITGAGGHVIIDDTEVLLYRQHGANAMGSHDGIMAGLARATQVLGRTYRSWLEANRTSLTHVAPLLGTQARATLDAIEATPRRPGLARPRAMAALGLQRQGKLGTLALRLAEALGRI